MDLSKSRRLETSRRREFSTEARIASRLCVTTGLHRGERRVVPGVGADRVRLVEHAGLRGHQDVRRRGLQRGGARRGGGVHGQGPDHRGARRETRGARPDARRPRPHARRADLPARQEVPHARAPAHARDQRVGRRDLGRHVGFGRVCWRRVSRGASMWRFRELKRDTARSRGSFKTQIDRDTKSARLETRDWEVLEWRFANP